MTWRPDRFDPTRKGMTRHAPTYLVALLALLSSLVATRPCGAGEVGLSFAGSGRAYFVPRAFFANVFDNWTNAPNWGTNLTVGVTGLTVFDPELVVELGSLALPEGNYRLKDSATWRTVRVNLDLVQVSVALRLRFDWTPWQGLHAGLAVGGGVARLFGQAESREVLPGCQEPVGECGAWDDVATHRLGFADQVLPVVVALGHVGYELWPGWQAVVEGGLQNLPFVGVALRYQLGVMNHAPTRPPRSVDARWQP